MAIYTELNSEVMKKYNRMSFSGLFEVYVYIHTHICIYILVCIYVHLYIYVSFSQCTHKILFRDFTTQFC